MHETFGVEFVVHDEIGVVTGSVWTKQRPGSTDVIF